PKYGGAPMGTNRPIAWIRLPRMIFCPTISGRGQGVVADLKSDFAVTKFLPPKPWRPLVLRQQLRAGLIDGWRRKLILACAPAGFGKTTFLAQYCAWLQEQGMRACWLSLEPRDRDP